eukprot:gene26182-biopygen14670
MIIGPTFGASWQAKESPRFLSPARKHQRIVAELGLDAAPEHPDRACSSQSWTHDLRQVLGAGWGCLRSDVEYGHGSVLGASL